MTDVIEALPAARALLERLAPSVDSSVAVRTKIGPGGWIPEADRDDFAEWQRSSRAATRFLLAAVDWNVELLERLRDCPGLSSDAEDIASDAWCMANSARLDPHTSPDEHSESLAWSLAFAALMDERPDPAIWRQCDRVAALEVLESVARSIEEKRDIYLHPDRLIDVERARLSLIMFEPMMPDRRH